MVRTLNTRRLAQYKSNSEQHINKNAQLSIPGLALDIKVEFDADDSVKEEVDDSHESQFPFEFVDVDLVECKTESTEKDDNLFEVLFESGEIQYMEMEDFKPFKCYCGYNFGERTRLKDHQRICKTSEGIEDLNSNPPRIKCNKCDSIYKENLSLRIHYTNHHGENSTKFKCKFCNEGFASLISRNHHIRSKHPEEDPNKCHLCKKTFSKPSNLTKHMITHLKKSFEEPKSDKPFKCNGKDCNQSYGSKPHLIRHLLECQAPEVIKDISIQLRLKCEICDLPFECKQGLARHVDREHRSSSSKTYKCGTCDVTFTSIITRNNHMRLKHPKVNCHSCICQICKKTFARSDNLKKHLKNVHAVQNCIIKNETVKTES